MTDRDDILRRIRACLALGRSPEPNEAAAAMHKARELMDRYDISETDVALSEVKEKGANAGRQCRQPPAWLLLLASTVDRAFGVAHIICRKASGNPDIMFAGVGPAAEVAAYAFTVLRRKCEAARRAYYKRSRGIRAGRIARSDTYALGWVNAVWDMVAAFARDVPAVVERYLAERYPNRLTVQSRLNKCNGAGLAWMRGVEDGSKVELQHGVRAGECLKLT